MDSITWTPYIQMVLSRSQSIEQIVQMICNENSLDADVVSSQTNSQIISLVLQTILAQNVVSNNYIAPLIDQQRKNDVHDASIRHQQRCSAISHVVEAAISQKLLHSDSPLTNLFNWESFQHRLADLRAAFPETEFNHALAVKANPMRGIFRSVRAQGFGAECASIAEAKHALSLGFNPRQIVYDSPCKTIGELREMLLAGVYINLDNEEEIYKVNQIFAELTVSDEKRDKHAKQIGLRINPVLGRGAIDATSTATVSSKFGLPLTEETKHRLLMIFKQNPWLQGVHVHVGSQGCSLNLLAAGAKKAVAFALEVNAYVGNKQVTVLDIGGGMPTVYDGGKHEAHDFKEYADLLRQQVPELFTSGFSSIITEFGRSVFVKPGMTVSRVEAIKDWAGQHIAVIHVGADQFSRTAYLPEQWSHCISILDSHGRPKINLGSTYLRQDIAGPLCFSGDFLAKKVLLPRIQVGDYVVIHDTGGYTMSMHSKYNSRQVSSTFAYLTRDGHNVKFSMLKERESTEETLACWGVNHDIEL